MKYPLAILIFIFCLPLTTRSQNAPNDQLKGYVTQQNSGARSLSGVQVKASWANATTSDRNGRFVLTFYDLEPGEDVYVNPEKPGWEVVNERSMATQLPENSDHQLFKIVMCRRGQLDSLRVVYYEISEEVITRRYRAQIAALEREGRNLIQERDSIKAQYRAQKKYARELADRFARTNFDDVSQLYKQAFEHFKQGEIEAAIELLEQADLVARAQARIAEREKIRELREEADRREEENEKGIQEDMEAIRFAAELYTLTFQYDLADTMYQQLIALDTSNYQNRFEYAVFLKDINRYDPAIAEFQALLDKSLEPWQIGLIHGYLSELYEELGKLPMARGEIDSVVSHYEKLVQADSISFFYRSNLAVSYSKLGGIFEKQGQLDSALHYFEIETELFKELYAANPQSESMKNGLAISYSKLGGIFEKQGQLDSALHYFEIRSRLGQELYAANPRSIDMYGGLGISYVKLGGVYGRLEEYDSTRYYLEEAFLIFLDIYEQTGIPRWGQYAQTLSEPVAQLNAALLSPAEKARRVEIKIGELKEQGGNKADLASQYGNLAWYRLFTQEYAEAEAAAREALRLDPSGAEWVHTNLALTLLLQDRYAEAEAIYRRYKGRRYDTDRSWDEVFLSDIRELEEAGIRHGDFGRVRKLLEGSGKK